MAIHASPFIRCAGFKIADVVRVFSLPPSTFAAHELANDLAALSASAPLPVVDTATLTAASKSFIAIGELATDRHLLALAQERAVAVDGHHAEGYSVQARQKSNQHSNAPFVFVVGDDSAGTWYGTKTVLGLLGGGPHATATTAAAAATAMPCVTVRDWPDTPIRVRVPFNHFVSCQLSREYPAGMDKVHRARQRTLRTPSSI